MLLLFATLLAVIPGAIFAQPTPAPAPGGRLIVAQRSEPRSLHPVFAVDEPSRSVIGLLHAPLLRIHGGTRLPEGVLAESWKVSPDGREIQVRLRPNLRFSDGSPLTVEDILFTFRVHLDPKVASPLQESLRIAGEPLQFERTGDRGIRFRVAGPYALGERLLAGIVILPRHRLEKLHQAGTLAQAWTLGTPPGEVTGAGPFRLKRVDPGRRLIVERNPHYSRKDRQGRALPYLDEIEFLSTAGEDAQVARLLAGDADLIAGFGGSSYRAIEAAAAAANVRAIDAGPSLDYTFLLFNLNPAAKTLAASAWMEMAEFRRAVSLAIDRAAIARLVYRDRASAIWQPVSPARRPWFDVSLPRPAKSPDAAKALLRDAGFRMTDASTLVDRQGVPVRLTILANAANPAYQQTAALIEEDLKSIGIEARLVPLEFRSLVDRVLNKRDYDLALMALRPGEVDPVADMNAFVSQGRTRLWNLSGRADRPWEAELDRLMAEQMTLRDPARRQRLFGMVQAILARELPVVCLVSPNLLFAVRGPLRNLQPAVVGDLVLWNADELHWEGGRRRR